MKEQYIIEMEGITKSFPGILANDNITLRLKKGEIHALLGENGAGKSTLMSVLFGLYKADLGTIKKNGRAVEINSPNDATDLGVGMVHQHFKLIDAFTVLDNIILGAEDAKFGFLDRKKAKKRVTALCEKYNLKVDLNKKIDEISVGMQQRTEILKMLYRDNEILIFDEPTAVLTPSETQELLGIMKGFTNEGKSILFITHKLKEVFAVCDSVTVVRKGKLVGTVKTKDTNASELSEMMVGRPVSLFVDKKPNKADKELLKIEKLSVYSDDKSKNFVKNASLYVNKGEIVAVAGVDGNGQSELVEAITGLLKNKEGKVFLSGKDITNHSVRQINLAGINHIPEDRHKRGLILDFTLENNCVLKEYFKEGYQKYGFIKNEKVRSYAHSLIDKYDIRCAEGAETITRSMSGGNQQKAIIARETDGEFSLLIAVQPTRGLDIGAIEGVHKKLIELRDRGKGILLVSLELDEVLSISDRIYVMYEGEITGEFVTDKTNASELGLYMSGGKRMSAGDVK